MPKKILLQQFKTINQGQTVAAIIATIKAAMEHPELLYGLSSAVFAAYLEDGSLPRITIPNMGEGEDRDTTILVGVLMGATLAHIGMAGPGADAN